MTDGHQAAEGYKCSCGYMTDDKLTFGNHLRRSALKDGKGTHTSLGRVNLETGDIILPPWNKRNKGQRQVSLYAVNTSVPLEEIPGSPPVAQETDKKRNRPKNEKTKAAKPLGSIGTKNLQSATRLNFVPRVYTTGYTIIMQQGMDAAINVLGWPQDIPLEDFLDTVIYNYFNSIGIPLGKYEVDEKLLAALKELHEQPELEPEPGLEPELEPIAST